MDTKERILAESFLLFLNKGLKKVTIDDIAKKSEIRSGTIYYYFKNKDELIYMVIKQFFFFNMDIEKLEDVKKINMSTKEKINQLFYLILSKDPSSFLDSKELNEKIQESYNYRDLIFFVLESMKYYDTIVKENQFYTIKFKNILVDIIDDGKINGEIGKDIKTEYIVKSIYTQALGNFFELLLNPEIDIATEIKCNMDIFWVYIEK